MNRSPALFVVSSVEEQLGKRERQEGLQGGLRIQKKYPGSFFFKALAGLTYLPT